MGAGLGDDDASGWLRTERRERAMTEAPAGGGRAEIERTLVQRSMEDEAFRQRLLADPKAAVEEELGTRLPEGVEVRAVEESPDTIYLVLPDKSAVGQGGELSDQELEALAGGWELGGQPTGSVMYDC
jgi:Nitrile hydratase, alpha chain